VARQALTLALVALALVATGCGSDDESETSATTEWASEFCTATITWSNEVERIGDDLSDLSSLSSDAIASAAEEARTATAAYADEIRDLGGPDTDSGQVVEDSLETLATDVDDELAENEDAIEDISGITGITTAAREVRSSMAAMFVSLQGAFQRMSEADVDGELAAAFDEAASCDEISR
jgi:hypothetical protein